MKRHCETCSHWEQGNYDPEEGYCYLYETDAAINAQCSDHETPQVPADYDTGESGDYGYN